MNKILLETKRYLSLIVTIGLFIVYYMIIDPDTDFNVSGIPTELLLALNIYIIAILGIYIIEFIPDFILDKIYGEGSKLVDVADNDPIGAGLLLVSKSIRLLAYGIIIAASIIAYNSN